MPSARRTGNLTARRLGLSSVGRTEGRRAHKEYGERGPNRLPLTKLGGPVFIQRVRQVRYEGEIRGKDEKRKVERKCCKVGLVGDRPARRVNFVSRARWQVRGRIRELGYSQGG